MVIILILWGKLFCVLVSIGSCVEVVVVDFFNLFVVDFWFFWFKRFVLVCFFKLYKGVEGICIKLLCLVINLVFVSMLFILIVVLFFIVGFVFGGKLYIFFFNI